MKTYQQCVEIIQKGGSVILGGGVISDIKSLPSPEKFAANDPKQAQAILDKIVADREASAKMEQALRAIVEAPQTTEAVPAAQSLPDLSFPEPDEVLTDEISADIISTSGRKNR